VKPTQLLVEWVLKDLSSEAKCQRREARNSLSFCAQLKNERRYTSTPIYIYMVFVCAFVCVRQPSVNEIFCLTALLTGGLNSGTTQQRTKGHIPKDKNSQLYAYL